MANICVITTFCHCFFLYMAMSFGGPLDAYLNNIGIAWEFHFLYNITIIYIIDFTLSIDHELQFKVIDNY